MPDHGVVEATNVDALRTPTRELNRPDTRFDGYRRTGAGTGLTGSPEGWTGRSFAVFSVALRIEARV